MKNYILVAFATLFCSQLYSQVGIGNTNPNALLDISASNVATPSNEDGLLIPRIDDFPSANPTVAQDGMMVFITGNSTPSKGFYYWDQGSSSWVAIGSSSEDSDWFITNSTSPPTSINDNIYTQGNVSIGSVSASSDRLYINNPVDESDSGIRLLNTGDNSGNATYGIYSLTNIGDVSRFSSLYNSILGNSDATFRAIENQFNNTGTGTKTGVYNEFNFNALQGGKIGVENRFEGSDSFATGIINDAPGAWSVTGTLTGTQNTLNAGGNGVRYGTRNSINGLGSGAKYGSHNSIGATAGGTHYGVFSDVRKSNSYAGFFIGRMSFGTDGVLNRYLMPEVDGTAGQVMTTDGSGQLSFVTPTTGVEKIDDLIDGKSDNDGSEDGSSVFLGINAGAADDSSDNRNIGVGFQSLENNSSGNQNAALGYQSMQLNTTGTFNTAIGSRSLSLNTTGSNNIALGGNALSSSTTSSNIVAIGADALQNSTSNTSRIAIGYQALTANTTGENNMALGFQALSSNTTGFGNTAIGETALSNNVNGRQNVAIGFNAMGNSGADTRRSVAIGYNAMPITTGGSGVAVGIESMRFTTTGVENAAFGNRSLYENTTGSRNTAIGYQNMFNNTTGAENTSLGNQALALNTSGRENTAIGYQASGAILTSSNNTSLGYRAGAYAEGNNNVFLGHGAGNSDITSTQNVYIGKDAGGGTYDAMAGTGAENKSGNVFIGYQSGYNETGNNKLYIENSDANADNALIYGEFDNNILRTNAEFQIGNPTTTGYAFSTVDGTSGQVLTTDGSGNVTFQTPTGGNTLDEAYDEGGPGAGRTIIANNGAVDIQGTDGMRVEGNINAAESIIHDGDIDTFISFTPDRIEINAGGVNFLDIENTNSEIAFNEDSNAIDFRIESDAQANMFFVDGSENTIGIGTNTPRSPLHINVQTPFDLDHFNVGQDDIFLTGGGLNGINEVGASIGFGGTSNRNLQRRAAIASLQTGGDLDFTGLAFYVHGNAINQSPMVEGMRLSHEGFLGINNTNPTATLDVIGTLQYEDGNEAAGFVLTSDAAGNATWADPTTLITETDDQTIENFNYNPLSNILTLEIENDGIAPQTVDLSSLSSNDADWFEIGTTSPPNANTDDIFTQGKVGIGTSVNEANLNINHNETSDGLTDVVQSNVVSNSGNDNKIIIQNQFGSAQGGNNTALYNILIGNGSGTYKGLHNYSYAAVTGNIYGVDNVFSATGGGEHYGIRNFLTGTGTGAKYGVYNSIPTTAGGTHYGVYSDVTKTGSHAGYFLGNLTVGTTTGNTYTFPASRGTNGQIMTTDGAGQVTWEDPSTTTLSLARIIMNTNQTYGVASGWEKINFDTIDFDLNSDFDTTTDSFIAGSTGYYRINASWRCLSSTSTDDFGIAIIVNGNLSRAKRYDHIGNGPIIRDINRILQLNSGDVVEIHIFHSGALTLDSNDIAASFDIEQIR